MSENDFYVVNGNRYRGSRYANFADTAGIDPQGNVSPDPQYANTKTPEGTVVAAQPNFYASKTNYGGTAPTVSQPKTQQSGGVLDKIGGGGLKETAIGAALPFVGQNLGASIGSTLAVGGGLGEGIKTGVNNIANKVSSGLLGTSSGATGQAAAAQAGKNALLGNTGKAAAGSSVGSAFGTGIGSAAATLLTGGSIKDAAVSGIGSGVGFAIGNAILPGVGGFIGSTLGSLASSLFGSKPKRQTLGVHVAPDDKGTFSTTRATTKGSDVANAQKYGDAIAQTLNNFGKAVGLKFRAGDGLVAETNVGSKDTGSFYHSPSGVIRTTGTAGDVDSIALSFLKQKQSYDLGGDNDLNTYYTSALDKADSLSGLAADLDTYLGKRANAPSPSLIAMRNAGNSRFNFVS